MMTFDISSGYLVGSLILGLAYAYIFALRSDLRKEMAVGGALLLPFAFLAPFYIPEYWNPRYYFGLLRPFDVGVEDFLFCFFVGGISSVIYEFVLRKREKKLRKHARRILWTPYVLGTVLLLAGEYVFPAKSIMTLAITGAVVSVVMLFRRHDLAFQSLGAGILFTLLYLVFFSVFNALYPTYVSEIYHRSNLIGVYAIGIPIEELLFAFSVGAGWSIAYEYMFGYKTA